MSKVLIIKLGALGDMLRAAPAIRRLCLRYGKENVAILTTIAAFEELARELFGKTITVLVSPRHKGIAALRTGLVTETETF